MAEGVFNVLRSLIFFVGLIFANLYVLLLRKFSPQTFSTTRQK